MSKKVFTQIEKLATEASNPASSELDRMTTRQVLNLINSEDHKVAPAVKKTIPQIEKAVELVASAFQSGGRLFYVGAGTSGRLGVLDASECPPTFGVSPSLVQGVIAGGRRTLVRSREGIEDDVQAGKDDISKKNVGKSDVVIGIATSNRTPYTLSALGQAKKLGAKTVFICCNRPVKPPFKPDVIINPVCGPEVVAGSTRMKAGTATKLVLNMITTTAMVRIGKTYGNLMVDLEATSEKLTQRSIRILMLTCELDYRTAKKLLKRADGWVKAAILMHLKNIDLKTATTLLEKSAGHLSKALNEYKL
ncbi:MAG: N-acetylmuramic acid 6-phosphate etherase [candidate division Zixibacteria bacterium]|nr:N-acetylmuramic acid 6-phosphate etherase [candidate division Zixibacteria bacterium]